ncbi:MAG: type IX secretion system membrane protein PorP/SprF [Bacteroidetes bacterium]|nr:type IX secretion system membrane protein PorP/SprF [Bacteroidota bacterium]
MRATVLQFWGLMLVVLVTQAGVQAQGDALYTQYQFNKLAINPAYAGSRDAFSVTAVYRDQWRGIDGAPKTASLAMHAPVGSRIGLGLHLVDDRLGVVEETGAWGSFAFRIPAGSGQFALGLNGGAALYRTSLAGAFIGDNNDPVLSADQQLWLPNVGFGLYYHSERYYVGLAAPRLLDNDLRETSTALSGAQSGRQVRHFNAMTGFVFDLGENAKLRPAALLRYQENSPVQTEFNLSALLVERLWIGAGYRSGGSLDSYLEFNVTPMLRLGYSYDWVVNELGGQTGGSHEFLLGIDLPGKRDAASSPRQFLPSYF